MIRLQNKKYIPRANPSGQPPMVGAPGIIEFTFIAQSSGNTQLQFAYQRPWEIVKPAITYFEVTIHVRALAMSR